MKTDADLETKLETLKKYADKTTQREILERILKILADDSFIEMENPITQQYKVLASFNYLEQLILTINIPEDIRNEIPE
jgi:F0F1-type ATP synthase delta subunit